MAKSIRQKSGARIETVRAVRSKSVKCFLIYLVLC